MNERVLVLEGYDARLYVERGHLVTRDGFANEGKIRETHFPRGRCSIERIVIRAPGGTVSMEAIDWCARMGIAVSFVASDSTLLNCLIPMPARRTGKTGTGGFGGHRRRRKLGPVLLEKKLDSQVHAIDRDFPRLDIGNVSGRSTGTSEIHACKASLAETTTLVDFLALEGRAAQVYWNLFVESPLPWRPGRSNGFPRTGRRSLREQVGDANGSGMRPIRSMQS